MGRSLAQAHGALGRGGNGRRRAGLATRRRGYAKTSQSRLRQGFWPTVPRPQPATLAGECAAATEGTCVITGSLVRPPDLGGHPLLDRRRYAGGRFAMNCHQSSSAECRGQQGSEGVMAIITGTSGSDLLNGTSDADTIGGAAGADTLNGADAADTLTGGTGADRLSGGAGSDLFAFQAGDSVLTIAGNRVGTISGYDVIADFASGETGDKIAICRRRKRTGIVRRPFDAAIEQHARPQRWRADSVRTPRRLFVWRVRPTEAYANVVKWHGSKCAVAGSAATWKTQRQRSLTAPAITGLVAASQQRLGSRKDLLVVGLLPDAG